MLLCVDMHEELQYDLFSATSALLQQGAHVSILLRSFISLGLAFLAYGNFSIMCRSHEMFISPRSVLSFLASTFFPLLFPPQMKELLHYANDVAERSWTAALSSASSVKSSASSATSASSVVEGGTCTLECGKALPSKVVSFALGAPEKKY